MKFKANLLAILSAALPVAGLGADLPAQRTEHYAAQALKVQPMAGRLRISVGDGPGIGLTLTGPARIVDAVRVKVDRGLLIVEPPLQAAGSSVHIEEGVTVIARDGGTASVVIGGIDPRSGDREPPLEVLATVPAGTPLEVRELVGSTEIGDTDGPLVMTVSAGSAAIGRVRDVVLGIVGSGDIGIARVAGSLTVDLSGSGSVTVHRAELDRLRIDLSGSGDVRVDGRARQAELTLAGAGVIEVSEVDTRPAIRITGAGEVLVGNW